MEIKSVLEGILFAAGEPVAIERLAACLGTDEIAVEAACDALAGQYAYEQRGIRLLRLGDSYQMAAAKEHASSIRNVLEERKPQPLSKPAMEVLAIVAYHQPVTRASVESIRGVDSSNTVSILAEKELIEECGRLEAPGRPILYRTTPAFLRCFGLESLEHLPPLPGGEDADGQLRLSGGENP
jgi:segregation and condensation protein B